MSCARKGCPNAGTHHLQARVWAIGSHKARGGQPLTADLGLQFCLEHAGEEMIGRDLFDERFWRGIEDSLRRARRAPPDRASLEIRIVPGDVDFGSVVRKGMH